jgi:hypothetical protein
LNPSAQPIPESNIGGKRSKKEEDREDGDGGEDDEDGEGGEGEGKKDNKPKRRRIGNNDLKVLASFFIFY